MITREELAEMIDHSMLRPIVTDDDLIKGCEIAKKHSVISVCVKPYHVQTAKGVLEGTAVKVTTVIGFPHGGNTPKIKAAEAREAVADGAVELDMVCNIGAVKSGDWKLVERDIAAVVKVAGKNLVKVILETCYLTDEEKIEVCRIAERCGAGFVKTSTGFGTGGATIPDINLMRKAVSEKVQVKAAGGVRTLDAALAFRKAGATRLGATATESIMRELEEKCAKGK